MMCRVCLPIILGLHSPRLVPTCEVRVKEAQPVASSGAQINQALMLECRRFSILLCISVISI